MAVPAPTTREEIAALHAIDPDLDKLLKTLPPMEADYSNMPGVRAANAALVAKHIAGLGPLPETLTETTIPIPVPEAHPLADGSATLPAILIRPKVAPPGGSPLIFMLYGSGFITNGPDQQTATARGFAELFGASVLMPTYRLAPENRFPIAHEDAWAAAVWASANLEKLGAERAAGFWVQGQSAGGNLALGIVARNAKEEMDGVDPARRIGTGVRGMFLNIPYVMNAEHVPARFAELYFSEEQNADVESLDAKTLGFMFGAYAADRRDPRLSVMNYPDEVLRRMPRTYIQVMGRDPLRDGALIYERLLREFGVETKIDVYPGLVHGTPNFFPQLEVSAVIGEDQGRGMAWVLGAEVDEAKLPLMRKIVGSM